MPAALGPSLVVTAITSGPKSDSAVWLTPANVDRLNIGAVPTNQISWDQPHEGNLFETSLRAPRFPTCPRRLSGRLSQVAMKILYLTGGAGQMYCGSCLRDNALATELIARGHDVTLLPVYTPTLTDEPNVSGDKVFFGGISVYLEQYLPLFRRSPRWMDRLWDSTPMLRLASRRFAFNQPEDAW